MKLYTKGGDDGTTSLVGGARVRKTDLRIRAGGEIDETNGIIGVAAARCPDEEIVATLRQIQSDLLVVGAIVATPEGNKPGMEIDDTHIARLQGWIDAACDEVPPLQSFILPGGSETGASLHLARSICRRAERAVVALAEEATIPQPTRIYLNRLSDLLFALARQANHRSGVSDIPWPGHKTGP